MRKQLQHLILFSAIIAYLLFSHSCANPGAGPVGGPKDSIPPVILNMIPEPYATNVNSNEIAITFNEYVIQDNLSTKMVVSPPLAEKTTIKLKGKTIHIKFNEDLIPSRTYSVDLKDGIKDYNEGNKIESIRMLFSTYEHIDTLQIKGYLVDAFSENPVKDAFVTLYTIDEDSVFSTLRPDFIAKTDVKGFFLFDNLPSGNYKLYGLTDIDNNLMYTQPTEQIAFIDSFIVPSAEYIVSNDTVFAENDTIISSGHTQFWPDPLIAYVFAEDHFNQFVTSSGRVSRDQMQLSFNESLTDSFQLGLLSIKPDSAWSYIEYTPMRDSVSIWLTDTLLIKNDSLQLWVKYTGLDTLDQMVTQMDTIKMYFSQKEVKGKVKKKEVETIEAGFTFISNVTPNGFDLNKDIILEAPSPIHFLDTSMIHLKLVLNDSVSEKVPYSLEAFENSKRKFRLTYQPVEDKKYKLNIDSAVVSTLSGLTNLPFELIFKTQKNDFYGTAIFELSGNTEAAKIQLLQNSEKEPITNEITLKPDQKTVNFTFLKPGKYRVKLIVDKNNNGKWDTGNLSEKRLPEPVYYYSKIITVKSNWELKENWDLKANEHQLKDLKDNDKKKEEE